MCDGSWHFHVFGVKQDGLAWGLGLPGFAVVVVAVAVVVATVAFAFGTAGQTQHADGVSYSTATAFSALLSAELCPP